MKVFRDLTVTTLPEEIKENEGVKYALLRNDGVTKSEDIIVSIDYSKKSIQNWMLVIVYLRRNIEI